MRYGKRAAITYLVLGLATLLLALAQDSAAIIQTYGTAISATPDDPGYARDPELSRVASIFAMRPVSIECPTWDEWSSDPVAAMGALGYTFVGEAREWDFAIVGWRDGQNLCAAARSVGHEGVSLEDRGDGLLWEFTKYEVALGVLVLVHESYHLRASWKNRGKEGAVQCKAIRHFRYAVRFLGGSANLANRLMPYALREHRQITEFPQYRARHCRVPGS